MPLNTLNTKETRQAFARPLIPKQQKQNEND